MNLRSIPLCVCLLLACTLAHAQRVALVIGNAAYQNEKPLANPTNDAELIAEVLRKDLQFDDVKVSKNLARRDFNRLIAEFAQKAKGADAVFVYYSGHGMQRGGQNYLIPVDASIRDEADIDSEGVASAKLLAELENAAPKITVVVLDACRDNPYSTRSKSTTKGLARMGDVGEGMLVAYATRDGMTADDGSGRNSPYARALAQQLRNKEQPIRLTFEQVAEEVKAATGNKQKPVTYGDLKSSARLLPFFSGGKLGQDAATRGNVEQQDWKTAQQADSLAGYEVYLEQYPRGKWAQDAQAAITRLKQQQARSADDAAWQAAQQADSLAGYQAYLDDYPRGLYRSTAKIKLAALKENAARQAQEAARLAAAPQPGSVFRDCNDGSCPEMVWIPAGRFRMGSPSDEADRMDREGPQHDVNVGMFALGKTEITVGQFRAFVSASGYRTDAETNAGNANGCRAWDASDGKFDWRPGLSWKAPGFSQDDTHPVVCISHNDAQAYVDWLSRKSGKRYRLPSEAEWEYAARGGSSSARYWGNDPDQACRYANVTDTTAGPNGLKWPTKHNCNDGYWYTAPVAHYQPNSYGLYDMLGNAWEWTADCWNENYTGAPTNGSAWKSGDCGARVLRGGSWNDNPARVRSASRFRDGTAGRSFSTGFRVARTKD